MPANRIQEKQVEATVVIPSYNSERTIRSCLQCLMRQQTCIPFEVIVVDSSTDGTPEIIRAKFPFVHLIHVSERALPGRARNIGIQAARSNLILSTDSDCLVPPNWVQKMVQAHQQTPSLAIGGAIKNGNPERLVSWASYLNEFSEFLPNRPTAFVQTIPTGNLSYKKSVFQKYGFFPSNIFGDEPILNWKLFSHGNPLLFEPTIQVCHIHRDRLLSYLKHQLKLGKNSAWIRRTCQDDPLFSIKMGSLLPILPLFRCYRVMKRAFRWGQQSIGRLLSIAPLCFAGLLVWGVGFAIGLVKHRKHLLLYQIR